MKQYLIISAVIVIGCSISRKNETDTNTSTNTKMDSLPGKVDLELARYYYNKHFDNMVNYSLLNGFDLNDQFGSENSYVIIKVASDLASHGDSIVKKKMFGFLRDLSGLNFETGPSIYVLIDFYMDLNSHKELFTIGIEFLNPIRLYKEKGVDVDYGSDYARVVYGKLSRTMVRDDREFYNSKLRSLYHEAIKNNEKNIPQKVWHEFYPYLKQEFVSNNIQFILD